MIVELFGIPGSGKTHAINQIHPGAIKENKDIKDKAVDPIKKAIKSAIVWFPNAFKVRRAIKMCLSGVTVEPPKYKPVEISDFIKNISMLSTVYKLSRKDIYMDEGIVHRTISMCINYDIKKEVCADIIRSLGFAMNNVRVLFLDVSKEVCKESIVTRNRHLHSIDELSGDQLDQFLGSYDVYCHYIADLFGYKQIVRDDSKLKSIRG